MDIYKFTCKRTALENLKTIYNLTAESNSISSLKLTKQLLNMKGLKDG